MDQPAGQGQVILLAEDNDQVRRLNARILRSMGHEVLEAGHGREALEMFRTCGKKVRLLVSDVIMPFMGGRELADQILKIQPETQVLFISGYTDDVLGKNGILEPGVELLIKPFSNADLRTKVGDMLG